MNKEKLVTIIFPSRDRYDLVKKLLLSIEEKTYNKDKKDPFSMAVNREDLANLVGTSTETVIRTLSDFKDEQLIDIKARQITLLNMEKLKKMKN